MLGSQIRRLRRAGPGLRLSSLLVVLASGGYLLVLSGVTAGITDAATACPAWPGCGVAVETQHTPALVVAVAHRLTVGILGGLLAVAGWLAWNRDHSTRVRLALLLVGAMYALQIGVGATIAVTTPASFLSTLHLIVGIAVFWGLLVALVWTLEDEHGPALVGAFDRTAERSQEPDPEHLNSDRSPVLDRAIAYLRLTKPRLMWLLCLVALAGLALAGGPALDPVTVAGTLFGGVLAIGASGTFNNVLERDRDEQMQRTADRPLATETIPVGRATAFGTVLTVASVAVFLTFVNALAAALGLLAILFYSVVYTIVLKPHTSANVVIGGVVGGIPALIGWAAVTGTVGVPAIVLGMVIFLWTPAHFYNLALAYRADYERAGFPMLPVVAGEQKTARHIVLYFGATMLAAAGLAAVTDLGTLYAAGVLLFAAVFFHAVGRLYRHHSRSAALRTFHASNAFLAVLLGSILLETLVV
ncbi:protoheme IX farnesyltransferase [Halalkaliarchaeum desulfuricum]|uniref:Protoheme IX farnesyltransferase n=1 Tax=Halalkaliarchaeum desulfuricum TaxID=2055893 RepID=A0A343TJF4_9EURY|nr:heme o synthase [Halalkaliarchaeum desulfuricum]AUX09226.1 protoheme IX farnesyltransferase [Halalkaliarchaeum desulfuricum]